MNPIEEVLEKYTTTSMALDWPAWGALHSEKVVKMFPDSPPARSRKEMLDNVENGMKGRKFSEFKVSPVETRILDNIAFAWGFYTWETRSLEGKDPLNYSGKFLTLFTRQSDGSWLISYDCFNSNTP